MKHAFIDIYSGLDTRVHRVDARLKIIFLLIFLSAVIFTPVTYSQGFLFYGFILFVLAYWSRIPPVFIFKRLANVLPFIILVSLSAFFKRQGGALFAGCVIKALLASLATLLVSSTTNFTRLLEAAKQLGVPDLFLRLFSFMYRYSFIMEDQILRSLRACESRSVAGRGNLPRVRILGNILGTIFVRTYERAEKVYLAMCARGYTDEKSH